MGTNEYELLMSEEDRDRIHTGLGLYLDALRLVKSERNDEERAAVRALRDRLWTLRPASEEMDRETDEVEAEALSKQRDLRLVGDGTEPWSWGVAPPKGDKA